MKITITKKNGKQGNLFIGTPNAKGQVVVATFANPTQAVKFYKQYTGEWHGQYSSYGCTIKAEYSQSTTYYSLTELRSKEFWKDMFGTSNKAIAKAEAKHCLTVQLEKEIAEREAKTKASMQQVNETSTTSLKEWKLSGAQHPCPIEVLDAKHKSGLNWKDFTNAI